MKCPRCGAVNEEAGRFCHNCGAPMEQQAPEDVPESSSTGACANCGFVNESGAKFCLNCGAPMNGTQAPSHPKRTLPWKKILIGAICAVILVIAVVVCVNLLQTGNYMPVDDSFYTLQVDDEYYITLSNGKTTKIEADEAYGCSIDKNLDGTKAAIFSYEDRELYYYADGAATLVAEDVADYAIAAEGDAIAYLIADDDLYDLFLYSGGKSKQLASDVGDLYFCISPDGGTVGYVSDIDFDEETCKGYIWDGKAEELGKNKVPVAASNDGKYIYYVKLSDSDSTLYVQKGLKEDTKVKLGDEDEIYNVYFNFDGSEVLIQGDEKTYLCMDGGEREKIASSRCYPILPYGTQYCNSGDSSFYGVKSFQNMYYYSYSSSNSAYKIIYLNKKNETSTAASSASSWFLSSDGKTLYFLKGDSIRKINGTKSDAEAVTLVEEDVVHFTISADGKTVFFVNDDGELYGQKGTKKATLICDDLEDGYLGQASIFHGKTIFYISDDELYASTGEKGTKVSGISGEATTVTCNAFAVTVIADDDGETIVYRSSDGKNFTVFAQY